jgi:hypothetical protein
VRAPAPWRTFTLRSSAHYPASCSMLHARARATPAGPACGCPFPRRWNAGPCGRHAEANKIREFPSSFSFMLSSDSLVSYHFDPAEWINCTIT